MFLKIPLNIKLKKDLSALKTVSLHQVDYIGVHWEQIVAELHEWSKVMAFEQALNMTTLA
jgi:hypothetical protein